MPFPNFWENHAFDRTPKSLCHARGNCQWRLVVDGYLRRKGASTAVGRMLIVRFIYPWDVRITIHVENSRNAVETLFQIVDRPVVFVREEPLFHSWSTKENKGGETTYGGKGFATRSSAKVSREGQAGRLDVYRECRSHTELEHCACIPHKNGIYTQRT